MQTKLQRTRVTITKRLLSLFLILIIVPTTNIVVFAETGMCGDEISWEKNDVGHVIIRGNGEMTDYHMPPGVVGETVSHFWGDIDITSVMVESGVESIGDWSFVSCKNLQNVSLPQGINRIGVSAFSSNPSLNKVNLPYGITIIGDMAFGGCKNLSNVSIPQTVDVIGVSSFYNTSIESICLPSSVQNIEVTTFANCKNLKTIAIPKSVKSIKESAFKDCYSLQNIYYGGTLDEWNQISILSGNECLYNANIHYESYVNVILNGRKLSFVYPPVIIGGRTLVPLRAVFEAFGATVIWDDKTKTVTSTLDDTTVKLTIDSNILYKNGIAVTLDVPAQLINGYTMVPVRAVAEAFGANVDWDGDTQTVYITTKGNTYSVNTVPQITYDGYDANFVDFNGMYIDSFTHTTNSNGTENVKFDVYNTSYIYGVVEIYYPDGKIKDVAIIDKMSNSTSIKGVLIDDTGRLIRDIWNGTALTYRQESGYSKKTSINIDIPQGGYIKITNDMSESFIASAINLSDMVFAAKSTFSTLSGFNSDTSKDFVYELSLKLINETAFAEAIKTPEKFTDKLWKGVGEELYMNSESVGGFLDTVSKNLDEFADGELAELMISTATDCGIGIAEGTFEALAGPAGVALKAMFTITSVTDVLIEMNDGLDCLYQGSINISAN